ncbi:MAG: hypothetical protein PHY43_03900 [Verrucomicrobiales bacterium]|nr:hypothetical protein [Verrucomicrobiales bacterium]
MAGILSSGGSEASSTVITPTATTGGASSPAVAGDGALLTGTGTVVGKKGKFSITNPDSSAVTLASLQALRDVAASALNLSGKATAAVTDQAASSAGDSNAQLAALLASQSKLAANVQSDGQSEQNATLLKVLGIAAAIIGLILFAPKLFKSKTA